MSYGDPTRGLHSMVLGRGGLQPFFRQAVELGITFWDTANVYQAGSSEEFVGRAIKTYARREDIVVATKVLREDARRPRRPGLSRAAILEQIDASLATARHRLRRSVPDPPLRPRHPGRGDNGGAARRRQGR